MLSNARDWQKSFKVSLNEKICFDLYLAAYSRFLFHKAALEIEDIACRFRKMLVITTSLMLDFAGHLFFSSHKLT